MNTELKRESPEKLLNGHPDVKVSLFAETLADAKKPLSYTAFMKWQKIDVEAGKSCKVEVSFPTAIDN
jgi:hypothetical protein